MTTTSFTIRLDITGASEGVKSVVRRMREGLRQDKIDLREVASAEGWSALEPIWNFDKQVAASSGGESGFLTVRVWNRPGICEGEQSRSFEFIGGSSPLSALNDLSSQHSGVDFNFTISVTSQTGDVVHTADGVCRDGMWER